MPEPKFRLGRVVATPGANRALDDANQNAMHFIALHVSGAWGDLDAEDRKANDDAIAHEGDPDRQQRVLSSYRTRNDVKIWVITEHDRSITTVLLPEEY